MMGRGHYIFRKRRPCRIRTLMGMLTNENQFQVEKKIDCDPRFLYKLSVYFFTDAIYKFHKCQKISEFCWIKVCSEFSFFIFVYFFFLFFPIYLGVFRVSLAFLSTVCSIFFLLQLGLSSIKKSIEIDFL